MKFTPAAAKSLEPGAHLIVDGCDGLRLVATETGKSWTYRYKSPADGKMKQIKLGSFPEMPLSRALVQWEETRAARLAGADPAADRRNEKAKSEQARLVAAAMPQRMTVADVANWYATQVMPKKTKNRQTCTIFVSQIENLLASSPLAGLWPEDLTRVQVYALIDSLSEKPVRTKIFKTNMAQAWDKALDSGRIPDKAQNWWRLVHRNGLQSRGKLVSGHHIGQQKRVLSVEEVGLTLADLYDRKICSELLADVLTLYLWTGCRGGELVQMRGDDLRDDDAGVLWWKLDKRLTKVGAHPLAFDLHVPLIGRAREIAERRRALAGAGFLFPVRGRQNDHIVQCTIASGLVSHHVYSRIRPHIARGRLQVANWSAHDLRRTVRTHLAAMGCPDKVAENMLGHIDSSIEGVYNRHGYVEHKVEWLTKLSERWEAALVAARTTHGPWRPWSETREQPPGMPSI